MSVMIPILRVSNADVGVNGQLLDVADVPRPWVVPSAPGRLRAPAPAQPVGRSAWLGHRRQSRVL